MKRVPQQHSNFNVRRERDRRALTRQALLFICGLIIAAGFIGAASRHFTAVRYGYENEKLRRERARLEQDQRRLILALNEASSPQSLDRAAREIGMKPAGAAQIEGAQSPTTLRPRAPLAVSTATASTFGR